MSTVTSRPESDLSPAKGHVIALLNQQLADAIDLSLQAKQAHWNVKGANFVSLHTLFDEIAQTLTELIDELAERAVELGGIAEGTLPAVLAASRLPVYDRELLAGAAHVSALRAAMTHFAQSTRAAIDTAAASGDATTADVFTEVSRAVDKLLWKLTAHGVAGR
ncbi:MAG TPA: DNA starvation/stationary phase protection protein Dps [Candidatus Synoicihabitans sp.]|nr:DNA starvation/stationary phase protection protein Dps [Candidatus Synoicihabitans sp.]